MFNWAVERLLSNAMNTFEKGRDIKAERTNVLEWQREDGKSSYCVEQGMMPKEERERWEGGSSKPLLLSIQGPQLAG